MSLTSTWNFTAVSVPPTEAEYARADAEAALLESLGIFDDDDDDYLF